MANLLETSNFDSGIYQIEINDFVKGILEGIYFEGIYIEGEVTNLESYNILTQLEL